MNFKKILLVILALLAACAAVVPELLGRGEPGLGYIQTFLLVVSLALGWLAASGDSASAKSASRWLGRATLLAVALVAILTLLHFPNQTGAPPEEVEDEGETFYEEAYRPTDESGQDAGEDAGGEYVTTAQATAEHEGVFEDVASFVATYNLQDKRVLEVGAGSGTLQDLVEDYTGLDIAESARRFFHKPFVQGSATALPFEDDSFDAAWSVWVLEHVPDPELSLAEMRRVVRPGGLIYLRPAWNCEPWRPNGYGKRPYSDFDLQGKLIKASLPIRSHTLFKNLYQIPIRLVRLASQSISGGPSRLHYRVIDGNFEQYWGPDSDAVNSIDPFEAKLWFESRGDACVSCAGHVPELYNPTTELIIQVNK